MPSSRGMISGPFCLKIGRSGDCVQHAEQGVGQGIGAPVRRVEDGRFLTGRGNFVDDIAMPNTAFAYVVRSPHAHARITRIDTTAALAAPGVLAVLTGEDVVRDKI